MQKLVLGSGLSLVLLGGAMTAQAQADPTSEDISTSEVKVLNEHSNEATDTTSQTPKIKFDGIDGEAQERTKGYLKIGDIKGESQTRADPFLKIDTISGESKASSRPFLKLGDIKGESRNQVDPTSLKIDTIPGESSTHTNKSGGKAETTWKVEEGEKAAAPDQASPFLKIGDIDGEAMDDAMPDEKKPK